MASTLKTDLAGFGDAVLAGPDGVTVRDPAVPRTQAMDQLARQAVFGPPEAVEPARRMLWELGQATGVRPASIHDLYPACGKGECGDRKSTRLNSSHVSESRMP